VLATYGYQQAFNFGHPELGAAAMISALPLVIPVAILLIRRLHRSGVQL
jgi:multiple sugar transport system permease protein